LIHSRTATTTRAESACNRLKIFMTPRIPFNRPFIAGKELFYIAQAVTSGKIAGDGHFTKACAELLEREYAIQKVLLTPSCTAALEMAAILCNLEPGDEVILPSYTFVSTANAVCRLGCKPVFVDVRPDTLNLNEELIEDAITPRTKALLPVHYAGVSCEMDRILAIANKHSLLVIEDAAQGVNASYKGKALGSLGNLGCYSFHETKNYICGEGGALCVNDADKIDRAEIIREKGTNRSRFFRGMVDKYTWVDIGSSYVPSEISSAFLYGQLELCDSIASRRREIYSCAFRRNAKPTTTCSTCSCPTCRLAPT
jgi:dTDP-4-amino-4,6-dideoxygalactose transaminase